MDERQLEYFLRVVELGSINRAAPTLGLSQPALSRHIAALEHEMRSSLFTRTQAGVLPTDAGRLLADRARPLLRQLVLLKAQVIEEAAGQVAVGTPPAWRTLFTSFFIAAMATRFPAVKLRVYEGLSNVLRDDMAAGLLDLSLLPFSAAAVPGYLQTPLVREPLVLVGRASDGLNMNSPVALSRLEGLNLVLPERPNVLRLQLERALERTRIRLRLAVETDTLAICLDLARMGIGFSVVPASALCGGACDTTISCAPIRGQQVTWALWENDARRHSQAVLEARRLVVQQVDSALKTGEWFGAVRVGSRPAETGQ